MPPIISIIIPVYNCEYTLADSLESVLSQSLSDIEIICVNDASRDASFEILKYYRRQDARIRIINQEHLGVAAARNRGITMASGRFLFFMDGDDFFPDADVLRDLYSAATESHCKIAGGSFCTFSEKNKRVVKAFQEPYEGYVFPADGLVFYEDYQFDLGFQRFIYDRELLIKNDIYFPPYRYFSEPVFFARAMQKAGAFYALSRISYVYRTGHKITLWTPQIIVDALLGILGNMQFAAEHNLANLYALTLHRLNPHLKKRIIQTRWGKFTEDINNTLAMIKGSVRTDLLRRSRYSFAMRGETAVRDLQRSAGHRTMRVIAFIYSLRPIRSLLLARHRHQSENGDFSQ